MITMRIARIKRATLLWNLLNVRETTSEIVDPCYLLDYLTNCQKYIYKSNNFVNRGFDGNWRKERMRMREREKKKTFVEIRFLLWSWMEWIVKWLQNGQIRGKIKEREGGRGVGGFAETRAGWNIEETRIVCTTGKEAISVTWTSPLVYIRGKGLYRAGFVSGFLLAIVVIITIRFYTWARR